MTTAREKGRKTKTDMLSESQRQWWDIREKLQAPFPAEVINWFHDGDKSFSTVEPREYEKRLDEIFGSDWKTEIEAYPGNLVKVTVFIKFNGEWIGRSSLGERDFTSSSWLAKEAQAFKRACSKWGLGRHLYSMNDEMADPREVMVLRNLGFICYLDDWMSKEAELCTAVSNGTADSIDQLNPVECRKLIYGISERINENVDSFILEQTDDEEEDDDDGMYDEIDFG